MNEYLVDLYCRDLETANSDLLRISQLLNDLAQRCGASFTCRWARQRARNGLSFELRIYAASSRETARSIALTLAEELRRLGYGAHVRPRDTFVIVRKGKERLAAILHRLGLLTNLYTSDMPPRVRKRIEEALHELEGSIKICEVPEEKLHEFYTDLLNKINEEYQKLLEKHRDSKTALEKLQEKYHDLYIKLPHDLDTLRRKLQEKKDYITWLTITDGITSIIVDHNVDTLQYGTTRPELLTIVTKALGIVKIHITTPDNKTNKPHIVATHNNYIIHKIYGKYIPETDQIIQNIRKIFKRTKTEIIKYLHKKGINIENANTISSINKILKNLYENGNIRFEEVELVAKENSENIKHLVENKVLALAGVIDGDGVVEKMKEDTYGVSVSFAPYTVKGVIVLSLIKMLENEGLILLNGFRQRRLCYSIWLPPSTRSELARKLMHYQRALRIKHLSEKPTTNMITRAIVDIETAIKALAEVHEYLEKVDVSYNSELKIVRSGKTREVKLYIKFVKGKSSEVRLMEIANRVSEILRRNGISARQVPKSAMVEVKRGKLELAYIMHILGLLTGELIPPDATDQIKRVILSRVDELNMQKEYIEELLRRNGLVQGSSVK